MSKKRANRNTKKTLKALKQKRAKFNDGSKAKLEDTAVYQKAKPSETSLMGRIGEFFRAGNDGRNFVDNTFGRATEFVRAGNDGRNFIDNTFGKASEFVRAGEDGKNFVDNTFGKA